MLEIKRSDFPADVEFFDVDGVPVVMSEDGEFCKRFGGTDKDGKLVLVDFDSSRTKFYGSYSDFDEFCATAKELMDNAVPF